MNTFSSTFGNGYACAFGELRATSFRQACRNGLAQVRGYGKYKRTETPPLRGVHVQVRAQPHRLQRQRRP